jgi:hypothetical protein
MNLECRGNATHFGDVLASPEAFVVSLGHSTSEPVWFGRERKKETLDGFFQKELSDAQRRNLDAACVEMWEPLPAKHPAGGAAMPHCL